MGTQAYSFLDVSGSITGPGGAFNLGSGVAEEGFSIDRTDDKSTMTMGADGQAMHSLHAGKPATVTVRLLKTSPTNALLSAMYALQTTSSALHGQNVLLFRDSARGDIVTCQQAAFKRYTPVKYGKIGDMMEWVFDVGIVDGFIGRN